jgi:hypothetical protein
MNLVVSVHPEKFKSFKKGYVMALKFTEELEDKKLSKSAKVHIEESCASFFGKNYKNIAEAIRDYDYDIERAGSDFWYSRNGHGTGFWDRELEDIGEELHRACQHDPIHIYIEKNKIQVG